MKTFYSKLIFTGLLALSSAACSTHHQVKLNTDSNLLSGQAKYEESSILEIISQESQRAILAQQSLLKYSQTYSDVIDYRTKNFETDKIYVDYIGSPRNVLASVAIKYDYRFIEQGKLRDLPVVNFTNYYATPEQIVVQVDAQIGQSAKVSVDKNNKVITLHY